MSEVQQVTDILLTLLFVDLMEFFLFVGFIAFSIKVLEYFGIKINDWLDLLLFAFVVVFAYNLVVSPAIHWESQLLQVLKLLISNALGGSGCESLLL